MRRCLGHTGLCRDGWKKPGSGRDCEKHLNHKKVEIASCRCSSVFMFCGIFLTVIHVFDALGATDDWYRECNESLSLVNGERGER
jgi:hypothetical protein